MSPAPDRRPFFQRHRALPKAGRVTAVLITTGGAALIAVPAGAAARSPAHTSAPASRDATTAACPWATSHAPIAQRVAQLMSHMTIPDEITMVEGQGTTNAYVFYMASIPSLCIPAMGEEDGPMGWPTG